MAFFLATTAVNVSNFLFHLVVVRDLSASDYGALGALLGLMLVIAVPTVALQIAITREVADRHTSDEAVPVVIGPLLAEALLWGAGGTAVLIALSPVIQAFLHLPSLTAAVVFALFVLPSAVSLVPKAVLLGELRFRMVAFALVAGAVVRLLLANVMTERSGIEGALGATVIGEVVTGMVLMPALSKFVKPISGVAPLRPRLRDGTNALFGLTAFWLLASIDTVLARHYLPREESGLYAAAARAASLVLFLPGAVSTVAFSRFAHAGKDGPKARTLLVQALGLVALLATASALVLLVAPELIVKTLFGDRYAASSQALRVLAISAVFLGLLSMLIHFFLAQRSRMASILPWLAVVFASGGVVVASDSPLTIAVVMVSVTGGALLLMVRVALRPPPPDPVEDVIRNRGDLWDLADPDLDLTVVIPYFNPGPNFRSNIERIVEVLDPTSATFEVIAVSDGSTDGSTESLAQIRDERVRSVVLPSNSGKGEALRTGLGMGRGRYLGFIDADGDVSPEALVEFVRLVELYEPDVVLGSKRHSMSQVQYPPLRRLYSWGYQQLIRALFHLNVRDTQTGVKLVKRELLADVLPRMVEKRFAFDLEMFVVARHLGYRRFFEAPVIIQHQFRSTINVGSVRGMLQDTLAIFYRLRWMRFYGPQREEAVVVQEAPTDPNLLTDRPES